MIREISTAKNIVMLASPNAEVLDVIGPLDVFSIANSIVEKSGKRPPYCLHILADQAGAFVTSSGLRLVADSSWRDWGGEIDTLLISGCKDPSVFFTNSPLVGWIRNMSGTVKRMVSICTGAFALAEAGLLDGRRATTHWFFAEQLANSYAKVSVDADAIYVRDGDTYTSAGITTGMDLALSLVEEDLGREISLLTARVLVMYFKRPGGQSQFSTQLRAQHVKNGQLGKLLEWIAENSHYPMTVEMLADKAAMSQRNFARVFAAETGRTPARYLEEIRIEKAIGLLEETKMPMKSIAQKAGFSCIEQFRRTFKRHLGIPPQAYRERFPLN
ncbi:GlxA family transcriptional regulator [Methylomonas methanica]|uniref:GlxA family transcriptional regulator n=1 Tax=Methylomonas methanica TaxID=421 RepID=UPI000318CC69|nr:GlxA family transcriptional regulator [Methylomonas methanica]